MENSELLKLVEEIKECKGFKLESDLKNLELSFKLMVINYGYVEHILKNVRSFSVNEGDEKDKLMMEATRSFVNYLSSAGALRDHTRKFIRKTYGSDQNAFEGEYSKKIKEEFSDDPLSQLIEALRNHYCHIGIPPLGIQTKIVNGTYESKFVVFLEDIDLKQSPKAKKYVRNSDEKIADVLTLAEKYTHKSIFPWIIRTISEKHKKDLDYLNFLRSKADELRK